MASSSRLDSSKLNSKLLDKGFVAEVNEPIFKSITVANANGRLIDRSTDTEAKILNNVATQLGNNSKASGNIILFTEREPCVSCTMNIEKFRKKYPNVSLNIVDSNGHLYTPNRRGTVSEMNKPSYFDIRLDVLEAFYLFLIQKGYGMNMNCEDILGYLSYDYEEGYSKMNKIMIDVVIYALEGKISSSKHVFNKIKSNIIDNIQSLDFKLLIRLLPDDEKTELLSDLYLLSLIDISFRDQLL